AYANLRVLENGTELAIASAGHPLPLLLHPDGRLEHVGEPGTLLGVIPQIELHPSRVDLQPGDTLVLYTDGVTEARTNGGEMFGIEGLSSALRAGGGCEQ